MRINADKAYIERMRTTLNLSDEAYRVVKAAARERKVSLGTVISEFILRTRCQPGRSEA